MGLDEVKAFLGEKGRVSKKGFYSGILLGRPAGGYSGLKAGDYIFPDSEILQIYPSLDLGSFGPEEQIVYTGIAEGVIFLED